MKILLASTSSGSRGGGELFLLYLGKGLVDRGHEVLLWVSSHRRMDELSERFQSLGEVIRAAYTNTYDRPGRSLSALLDVRTRRTVARQWRTLAPDCIHLNKQNLEDGLDLLAALPSNGLGAICTIHLTQDAKRLGARAAALRDVVARHALRRARVPFVTVVESRRRDLQNFLGGDQGVVEMVQNGVPVRDLAGQRAVSRHNLELGGDEFAVVAIGRMVEQKRPLLFVEAVQRIRRDRPRVRAYWVGDGPLSGEWDREVAKRGLGAVIVRVDWQRDVTPFLAAADLFLHVADYEGLPLALLEAMAAGVPCGVTNNLRQELPFLDATNTLAVDDGDGWISALKNPATLEALGRSGKSLIESRFSCAEMARLYEGLYERYSRS